MDIGNFKKAVGKKIDSKRDFLMMPGQRDETGYMHTASRILKSAENLFFALGPSVHEPTRAMFQAFSERPGLNAVKNTAGVDIIDLTILAAVESFMPYVAAERGMDKPTDILTFEKLVAMNTAGGYTEGDDVVHPFSPIDKKINLGRANGTQTVTGTTSETTIDAGGPIAKGTVQIVLLPTGGTAPANNVTGQDLKGDGQIYWDKSGGPAVEIDYAAGSIIFTPGATGDSSAVTWEIDGTSEKDGAHTLKLRPENEDIKVETDPNRIILENSVEQMAYMNKQVANLSVAGVKMDYGKIALQQLFQAFIYFLNRDLVDTVLTSAKASLAAKWGGVPIDFDITPYALSTSQAQTKNDKMNEFMLNLETRLLRQSDSGMTAIMTGAEGARLLANNTDRWSSLPGFGQKLNGLVGTYNDIPVLRHDTLTISEGAGYATVVPLHKNADGRSAPAIYGEYLPVYSTKASVNFDNPTDFSQALFNQSKSAVCVSEYATLGRIKFA